MTISSCSSSADGYYIPSTCYSDGILVKTNKAQSAYLPLIIIGLIAWCGFLQALVPERFRGDGGYNGGGGGE